MRENIFSKVKIEKKRPVSLRVVLLKIRRTSVEQQSGDGECCQRWKNTASGSWLATLWFSFVIYFDCDNWVRRGTIYFNRDVLRATRALAVPCLLSTGALITCRFGVVFSQPSKPPKSLTHQCCYSTYSDDVCCSVVLSYKRISKDLSVFININF